MSGIDDTLPFTPLRIAVLTVSDTRDMDSDTSGALLEERIVQAGHALAERRIVRDEVETIRACVKDWVASSEIDVIISSGGTGLTARDVTPQAITPLFDKTLDGFSVIFHQTSFASVGLSTIQSRACAGLCGSTFIFCLPGSNGAVKDGWDKIIVYLLDSRHRPCNLSELLPRT